MRSHWVGLKRFQHPKAGALSLEYSTFTVDGGGGLSMVVFTPASPSDTQAIARLLAEKTRTAQQSGLGASADPSRRP